MKNKALIILFVIFVTVILASLFITQQSQKVVSLSEKEILIAEQAESRISSAYSPQVRQASIAALPSSKSGITIIKAPSTELKEKSIHASKIADKASNNVSGLNVASSTEAEDTLLPAGITKSGKQPTSKEAQEMNSSGIVLY